VGIINGAAHEGIAKPMDIGAAMHLLGEYVSYVGLSNNMLDRNSTIGIPFVIAFLQCSMWRFHLVVIL
jgi:hypothetical protein